MMTIASHSAPSMPVSRLRRIFFFLFFSCFFPLLCFVWRTNINTQSDALRQLLYAGVESPDFYSEYFFSPAPDSFLVHVSLFRFDSRSVSLNESFSIYSLSLSPTSPPTLAVGVARLTHTQCNLIYSWASIRVILVRLCLRSSGTGFCSSPSSSLPLSLLFCWSISLFVCVCLCLRMLNCCEYVHCVNNRHVGESMFSLLSLMPSSFYFTSENCCICLAVCWVLTQLTHSGFPRCRPSSRLHTQYAMNKGK